MTKKLIFTFLLAATMVSCDYDQLAEDAHRYFSQYTYITSSIESAVWQAYLDTTTDFNGSWLMSKGFLSGDSLLISHPMDEEFILSSNTANSTLALTAELLDSCFLDQGNIQKDIYRVIVSGEGTYVISTDTLFTYHIDHINGEFLHMIRYISYSTISEAPDYYENAGFIYSNGGEITLSMACGGKTRTYHYDLSDGHIRCRETNSIVLSYDD